MKAIRADNLTKMFGHLVVVGRISFEQALTCSQIWKLINKEWSRNLDKVQPIMSSDKCITDSGSVRRQVC